MPSVEWMFCISTFGNSIFVDPRLICALLCNAHYKVNKHFKGTSTIFEKTTKCVGRVCMHMKKKIAKISLVNI